MFEMLSLESDIYMHCDLFFVLNKFILLSFFPVNFMFYNKPNNGMKSYYNFNKISSTFYVNYEINKFVNFFVSFNVPNYVYIAFRDKLKY